MQGEGTALEAKAWRESRDRVLESHVGQCGWSSWRGRVTEETAVGTPG